MPTSARDRARRPGRLILAFVSALSSVAALGCASTHRHGFMAMSVERPKSTVAPGPGRPWPDDYGKAAIAPLEVREAGEAAGKEVKERLPVDRATFQREVAETLTRIGIFSKVETLEGDGGTQDVGTLLDVVVEDALLAYKGPTSDRAGSILFWTVAGMGAQWWHDEVYVLSCRLKVTVRDRASKKVLLDWQSDPIVLEDALCFHERNGRAVRYLYAYVYPPAGCPADGDAVLESLLPRALDGPAAALGRALAGVRWRDGVRAQLSSAPAEESGVRIVVHEPTDPLPSGAPLPLAFDVHVDKGLKELVRVEVNDRIVADYEEAVALPAGEKLTIPPSGTSLATPFVRDEVTIRVWLRDRKDSVDVILKRKPVREPVPVAGRGGK